MNVPNALSLSRILMIPIVVVLFLLDGILPYARIGSAAVFILAALTDMLDGKIARKFNLITDLGKFLDTIADKMLVISALVLLIFGDIAISLGNFVVIFVILIVNRELLISALRQIAAVKNIVIAADVFGKIKAISQMIAIPFLLCCTDVDPMLDHVFNGVEVFMWCGFVLLSISALLTLLSCINYLYRYRQVFKKD